MGWSLSTSNMCWQVHMMNSRYVLLFVHPVWVEDGCMVLTGKHHWTYININFNQNSSFCESSKRRMEEWWTTSPLKFSAVTRNNLGTVFDVQLLLSQQLKYPEAAVFGNNLTKIYWHETNDSLEEQPFAFNVESFISSSFNLPNLT